MNATIQVILEAHTPPEISHGNHLSWEHGKTKVILQSTWAAGASEQPWRDSYLRVSTKVSSCTRRANVCIQRNIVHRL